MPGSIRTTLACLFVLVLAPVAANAAGSGNGDSRPAGDPELARAETMVEAEQYAEAIPVLEGVVERDPRSADGYNYLGFANRKLGRFDEAEQHYKTALSIDDEHKGALEYLGELYLEKGDLPAAEAQLERLSDACWLFGCEEEDELEEKIAAYRARTTN